jgi:hypothetical protein
VEPAEPATGRVRSPDADEALNKLVEGIADRKTCQGQGTEGTGRGDAMGGKGDRLAVDLIGLEDFARNLDTVRTTMNGTRKLFDAYEAKLGSGKVADALHDFEHNWKDGRKEIDGHLEGLSKMANTVVREIKKQDKELADELEKSVKGDGGT